MCQAGGTAYTYDANGNMVASSGAVQRGIEYSAFNKPVRMSEGAK